MTANTGERENRDIPREYPEGPGDVPADTWAARLVLSRYHAGRLSIEKAAERCGINPGNWVRWENGAQPRDRVEESKAISAGLGMNFNWLLFGGPLLPARGRPAKRTGVVRPTYLTPACRPIVARPNGRPRAKDPIRPIRRVVDRTQPVAV